MATAALVGCTDEWDEHYTEDQSTKGTLWEAIQERSELSNFARVIEATGYGERLGSSQMFTVFAPVNEHFGSAEADELIADYNKEKAEGVREEDNKVVNQFVQNHIAMSNRSVSSLTNDSITLMNGKYETLTDKKFGESTILTRNQYVGNGVLFTIEKAEEYFPNVFEYIGQNGQTNKLYEFLNHYSVYEFDPDKSVAGDIVDGKTVYLDSVFHLTNSMLREYGHINREDSNYMALVPTDRVWGELYDEYVNYFNYNDLTSKRDSMIHVHTNRAIADGTIFNLNLQEAFLRDSARSTKYEDLYSYEISYAEPRYYIYRNPYAGGGAFAGAEETVCSNGRVLIQDQWNIDKRETFYQQIKVEAENNRYVDTIEQAKEPLTVRAVPKSNSFYGKVSENYFVEVIALSSIASNSVRYGIPDQLSNIGYDIYAVFVPAIAYNENASAEDRLPCRVKITLGYVEQDGTEEVITLRSPANKAYFETIPDVVDTLLVAENFVFPTCAFDLEDPQVTLKVASNFGSSMSSRFTRTLRMDCIILKPHEGE